MSDCIFCKIVAGEIPCQKVAENDHALAFLDIGPLSEGHTLVIPKQHGVTLDELSDESVAACAVMAKRVGEAVAKVTACDGWNLLQNNGTAAGQVVMHVHFHVIPRTEGDALGFRWPAGSLDADTAQRLRDALRSLLG